MILSAVDVSDEFTKQAIYFLFVFVLGGLAGLVLSTVRRRREIDLSSLEDFHRLYGFHHGDRVYKDHSVPF